MTHTCRQDSPAQAHASYIQGIRLSEYLASHPLHIKELVTDGDQLFNVHQEGFEPPTFCSEDRRSIQLSYWCDRGIVPQTFYR